MGLHHAVRGPPQLTVLLVFRNKIKDYGEERFVIIGMAEGDVLLFVAYTERETRIRMISARRATQREQDDYFRQNA